VQLRILFNKYKQIPTSKYIRMLLLLNIDSIFIYAVIIRRGFRNKKVGGELDEKIRFKSQVH